jgi:hypothetical protein
VQAFARGESIAFLQEFAQSATEAAADGYAVPGAINYYNYYNVRGASERRQGNIQYSSPRASMDTMQALMVEITRLFLGEVFCP